MILQLNHNHLPPLINNDFLCTGTIDYLIQRSIHFKMSERTIIASCLSLPIMQTYIQLDNELSKLDNTQTGNNHYGLTEKQIVQKQY
jgi:hypothetical protein